MLKCNIIIVIVIAIVEVPEFKDICSSRYFGELVVMFSFKCCGFVDYIMGQWDAYKMVHYFVQHDHCYNQPACL